MTKEELEQRVEQLEKEKTDLKIVIEDLRVCFNMFNKIDADTVPESVQLIYLNFLGIFQKVRPSK